MLQLKKFPDIPVSTREEARQSRTSRGAPFPPPSSRGGILSLRVRDRIPWIPSHLKRRRSPQERREELLGCATIPRVPQMSQSIPGKAVFPALPRLSIRGSTHTMVARGTALWEILVGKPRGKASRESHRSLDPREGNRRTAATDRGGKLMCLPPLETRTDSAGETPEVPQDPCQHWRGILRFWHTLHTRS